MLSFFLTNKDEYNRCGHWDVYTCVRRCSLSWVYAWQVWQARLHSARCISLCALVSLLSVCCEFLFCVWLTLTMLRFCGYKLRSYWFYICAFVENTFAVSWQFFCAFLAWPASCGALGHVLDFQQFIFFLPHFGAIKVRRHSLLSNVFRILRTTFIKVSLFFILLKIRKRIYIAFL